MSEPTKDQQLKVAALGEVILVADALLTAANRLTMWLQERREVGEMTPEEEKWHDAWKEKLFSSWQHRP